MLNTQPNIASHHIIHRITSHDIISDIVSYRISPALDDTTAVGMELTATEGARDGTSVAVDDVKCSILIDRVRWRIHIHINININAEHTT